MSGLSQTEIDGMASLRRVGGRYLLSSARGPLERQALDVGRTVLNNDAQAALAAEGKRGGCRFRIRKHRRDLLRVLAPGLVVDFLPRQGQELAVDHSKHAVGRHFQDQLFPGSASLA